MSDEDAQANFEKFFGTALTPHPSYSADGVYALRELRKKLYQLLTASPHAQMAAKFLPRGFDPNVLLSQRGDRYWYADDTAACEALDGALRFSFVDFEDIWEQPFEAVFRTRVPKQEDMSERRWSLFTRLEGFIAYIEKGGDEKVMVDPGQARPPAYMPAFVEELVGLARWHGVLPSHPFAQGFIPPLTPGSLLQRLRHSLPKAPPEAAQKKLAEEEIPK